jgi:hypothetical protein
MPLEHAGCTAVGVFLVENHLDHEVSARPVASVFVDSAGRQVRPEVKFDPEVVTLRGGEQLLVRVMAVIDETLEPDVRYQGEVTIPELTGTRISIVLRRPAVSRPGAPEYFRGRGLEPAQEAIKANQTPQKTFRAAKTLRTNGSAGRRQARGRLSCLRHVVVRCFRAAARSGPVVHREAVPHSCARWLPTPRATAVGPLQHYYR